MDDQISFDEPIRTLEQAKSFYTSMGCNGFHMYREFPERYEEFRQLQIPEQLKEQWRLEQFELALRELEKAESADLWWRFHELIGLSDWSRLALEQLLDAAKRLLVAAPRPDLVLVATALLDSNSIEARSGAVLRAYDAGYPSLAQQLLDVVFQLLANAVPNRPSSTKSIENYVVSSGLKGPHVDPERIEEVRARAILVAKLMTKPPKPSTLATLLRKIRQG